MPVLVPTSLDQAVSMLADAPDALVLAGGTDAMVAINAGLRKPHSVLAVNRVAELRSWTFVPESATLRIGSAVTYAELMEPPIADLVPALAEAARTVGSPQIRHAGTLGGLHWPYRAEERGVGHGVDWTFMAHGITWLREKKKART